MTDYRASGVDIDAGDETVRRIKTLARATFTSGVLSEIGSFGGLFRLDVLNHQECQPQQVRHFRVDARDRRARLHH